jgi:hypothetical protein
VLRILSFGSSVKKVTELGGNKIVDDLAHKRLEFAVPNVLTPPQRNNGPSNSGVDEALNHLQRAF